MIHIDCPKCGQKLSAKDDQRGRQIRCPACKSILRIPNEQFADEVLTVLPIDPLNPPPMRDEEDAPRPRRSRRDEDDEDERPRRRESNEDEGAPIWPWIAAGVGGLVVVGVLVMGFLFFLGAHGDHVVMEKPVAMPPELVGIDEIPLGDPNPPPPIVQENPPVVVDPLPLPPKVEPKKEPPGPVVVPDPPMKEEPKKEPKKPLDEPQPPMPPIKKIEPPQPKKVNPDFNLPPPIKIARDGKIKAKTQPSRRFGEVPPQFNKYGALAIHPDGKHFIAGETDGAIRLWNITTGKVAGQFEGNIGPVFQLALSKNGKRLLSGGWDKPDAKIRLWDVDSGKLLKEFAQHENKASSLALSADGQKALSCEWSFPAGPGLFFAWDTADAKPSFRLAGTPDSAIRKVAFYPGEEKFFLLRGNSRQKAGVTILDPVAGQEEWLFEATQDLNPEQIDHWAISDDGQKILLRYRQYLVLLDGRDGKPVRAWHIETSTHGAVAISPNGKLGLASGGASKSGKMFDCFIHVVNLETGKEIARFEGDRAFMPCLFTADSRGVLAAAARMITLWDLPK
ncbi:MAG: hypothetical protein L0215_03640 [Gemmataceae bacterium]|nr:hypothetical protein [Gemmataceae bacterium]